jgi:hypothetical protein
MRVGFEYIGTYPPEKQFLGYDEVEPSRKHGDKALIFVPVLFTDTKPVSP